MPASMAVVYCQIVIALERTKKTVPALFLSARKRVTQRQHERGNPPVLQEFRFGINSTVGAYTEIFYTVPTLRASYCFCSSETSIAFCIDTRNTSVSRFLHKQQQKALFGSELVGRKQQLADSAIEPIDTAEVYRQEERSNYIWGFPGILQR